MKILVTGPYETNYNRTRILLDGLKSLGHEVIEKPQSNNWSSLKEESKKYDILFVPCFMHKHVPQIKKYSSCPLVFDPLISKYITNVLDYKLASKFSFRGLKDKYRDKKAFQSSDLILVDTLARKKVFCEMFGVPESKLKVVYVGSNTKDFFPLEKTKNDFFHVGFVGGFIPLQGVKKIVQAAKTLENENIRFTLIGSGYEYDEVQKLVKNCDNVELTGWIEYQNLNKKLNSFDLCLGIFGDSIKAKSVIPNKIFHYASSGRPILTMKSDAITEIFRDGENIYLCENTPQKISETILELSKDPDQLDLVGKAGMNLVNSSYDEESVARMFIKFAIDI